MLGFNDDPIAKKLHYEVINEKEFSVIGNAMR